MTVKAKYGEYTDEQFSAYIKKLHSMVHWLLIYKEDGRNEILENYFDIIQRKIQGLNNLLSAPAELVELSVAVECIRNEFKKGEGCDDKVYRKLVLNAHSIVDKMPADGR